MSEHSDSSNDHVGGSGGSHADPSSEAAPSPQQQGGTIGIGTPIDPDELKRRKKRAEQPDEPTGEGPQEDPSAGA